VTSDARSAQIKRKEVPMIIVMILSWLVFGFLVGAIARALFPGTQPMGLFGTAGLGIVGSIVGGLIGNVIAGAPVLQLHGAGLIGSILGALLVMALMGFSSRRRVTTTTV
jgi:uncharacterized membrane protein YeaQ/YmgE (transglycosylase-associated protein family)